MPRAAGWRYSELTWQLIMKQSEFSSTNHHRLSFPLRFFFVARSLPYCRWRFGPGWRICAGISLEPRSPGDHSRSGAGFFACVMRSGALQQYCRSSPGPCAQPAAFIAADLRFLGAGRVVAHAGFLKSQPWLFGTAAACLVLAMSYFVFVFGSALMALYPKATRYRV